MASAGIRCWAFLYLPASAVKGLVRAWVEAWLYEATEEPKPRARLHAWFGSDHKDPKQRTQEAGTGEILFFDATPIAPVLLKVDIMTPHVGKWYEQGGQIRHPDQEPNRVPADWHDPTPIPFLVAERIELLFTLAPRNTAANSRTELHEVLDCLGNALEWLGAGAKTAIGYGHLEPDSKGDAALAAAVKSACDLTALAKMSPDQQRVHVLRTLLDTDRLINRPNPGGALMQQVAALLTEAHDWASDDREAAAALAEDAYGFHGWGKADKKRQRKQIIAGLRTTS